MSARALLLLSCEFTLLALLLGARTLFGFQRAPVQRCALLRQGGWNYLRGLTGPGLLAQAFGWPTEAGVALQVALAGVVQPPITSVIALAWWQQLAGHDGPQGNGGGRQCIRTGNPWQIAQASQALRQAAAPGRQHLGATQFGRV